MFRQGVIVAFVLGTMLNGWFLWGVAGGYQYYANVFPLDAAEAQRFAVWVEIVLIVLAAVAWWFSRPQSRQP